MVPTVIYVMGPPGAGKGTQAELLAKKINYHRFSTGDAFREVAGQDTDLGRRTKELIDNGYLAPPEMAAEIVIEAIKNHVEEGRSLVFDGTPRTIQEAALVDAYFAGHGYGRPLAVLLDVSREEMMARNAKRRFCLGIQGGFPVVSEADRKRCQELGGTVGKRPDDDPEKFATRWSQFQERTMPVVAKYQAEGILQKVNGIGTIDEVHQRVLEVIQEHGNGSAEITK